VNNAVNGMTRTNASEQYRWMAETDERVETKDEGIGTSARGRVVETFAVIISFELCVCTSHVLPRFPLNTPVANLPWP
jgi:hypothetical protein